MRLDGDDRMPVLSEKEKDADDLYFHVARVRQSMLSSTCVVICRCRKAAKAIPLYT